MFALTFISLANLTLVTLKCAVGPSGKCEITKPSREGLMEYWTNFQNLTTYIIFNICHFGSKILPALQVTVKKANCVGKPKKDTRCLHIFIDN